jgi:hypothetical protein
MRCAVMLESVDDMIRRQTAEKSLGNVHRVAPNEPVAVVTTEFETARLQSSVGFSSFALALSCWREDRRAVPVSNLAPKICVEFISQTLFTD